MKSLCKVCVSLICLALAGTLGAVELPAVIGHVRAVEGEAFFVSRGQTNAAHVGQAVLRGGTLTTGARGAVGLTLDDGSRLALGPGSELRLGEFVFEPASGRLQMELWLERGMLVVTAGDVARLAPGALRLETPEGAVEVLGDAQVAVRVAR